MLRELKHPNIVRLQNIVLEEKCIYLIFECLSMNLQKLLNLYLYNYQSLDAILIKSYLYQITLAVSFCHQRRIFHRDLCPKNILVDKKGWLKVSSNHRDHTHLIYRIKIQFYFLLDSLLILEMQDTIMLPTRNVHSPMTLSCFPIKRRNYF